MCAVLKLVLNILIYQCFEVWIITVCERCFHWVIIFFTLHFASINYLFKEDSEITLSYYHIVQLSLLPTLSVVVFTYMKILR